MIVSGTNVLVSVVVINIICSVKIVRISYIQIYVVFYLGEKNFL